MSKLFKFKDPVEIEVVELMLHRDFESFEVGFQNGTTVIKIDGSSAAFCKRVEIEMEVDCIIVKLHRYLLKDGIEADYWKSVHA